MMAKAWKSVRTYGIGASALALSGCIATIQEGPTTITGVAGNSGSSSSTSTSTGNGSLVCNPLSSGAGGTARDQGLTGELYYLSPTGTHYDNVASYIANGTKLDADLFFDQVNVPTRPFDQGFVTTDGQVIQTPDGNKLYEWFAVRFNSVLRLTNNDRPTQYQFALIADDGAVLSADFGNGFQTVVNNDGTHATELQVSQTPITLTGSDSLPIRIDYYQGPRYQIAVMLLWREWPANGDGSEPLANTAGVYEFFNPDYSPSQPEANYQTLLSHGWKVVPPENYYLPSTVAENPCPIATATATVSSTNTDTGTSVGGGGSTTDTSTDTNTGTGTGTDTGTSTGTSTSTSTTTTVNTTWTIQSFDGTTAPNLATLFWTTPGVPSSTTVYYGTSAGALNFVAYGETSADGVHTINIAGLAPNTLYFFQAESVDANGRTQQSAVITKVTKAAY